MIHAIMGEDTKILQRRGIEIYFVEQYKKLSLADEQQSWDTPYRAELNQLIHSDAMKEALALPLRAKLAAKRETRATKGFLSLPAKGATAFSSLLPSTTNRSICRHRKHSTDFDAGWTKKGMR